MRDYRENFLDLVKVTCDNCGLEQETLGGKYPLGWVRVKDPEGGDNCPRCREEEESNQD